MNDTLSAAEAGTRTSRRPLTIALSVIVGIAVLVGVFFIVDAIVRSVAQARVADEISAQLPAGVTASPEVRIGGTSVIAQYLSGSFDDITISAPDAVIDGIQADITLDLNGFPVDTSKPVERLSGTAVLTSEALDSLISRTAPNSAVELGQGDVSYAASATFLGFTVGYRVTGAVEAAGDSVLVRATGAEVTAGGGNFDLSKLLEAIIGQEPVSVCTAQYLPVGVLIDDIEVVPNAVRVQLKATNLVLNESTLQTLGSCAP